MLEKAPWEAALHAEKEAQVFDVTRLNFRNNFLIMGENYKASSEASFHTSFKISDGPSVLAFCPSAELGSKDPKTARVAWIAACRAWRRHGTRG